MRPGFTLRLAVLNSSLVLVENLVYRFYLTAFRIRLSEKEPSADLNVRHTTHDQSKEESNSYNNAISNPDWQRC